MRLWWEAEALHGVTMYSLVVVGGVRQMGQVDGLLHAADGAQVKGAWAGPGRGSEQCEAVPLGAAWSGEVRVR